MLASASGPAAPPPPVPVPDLAEMQPSISRRVVVCLEPRRRRTDDGIDVIGATDFVRELWQGEFV